MRSLTHTLNEVFDTHFVSVLPCVTAMLASTLVLPSLLWCVSGGFQDVERMGVCYLMLCRGAIES